MKAQEENQPNGPFSPNHKQLQKMQYLLFNKKCYQKTALGLPLLGLLAFTGCASFHGTADNHNPTNNKVATYMTQSQEGQPADSDSDPGYEWFY
jgi:hypothetical protein